MHHKGKMKWLSATIIDSSSSKKWKTQIQFSKYYFALNGVHTSIPFCSLSGSKTFSSAIPNSALRSVSVLSSTAATSVKSIGRSIALLRFCSSSTSRSRAANNPLRTVNCLSSKEDSWPTAWTKTNYHNQRIVVLWFRNRYYSNTKFTGRFIMVHQWLVFAPKYKVNSPHSPAMVWKQAIARTFITRHH